MHTHDLFSGVETITKCERISAVANSMVKELGNSRKPWTSEIFWKMWMLTFGFGRMLWLQNILFWQNKNSFKEFQWLAHVPGTVALEIQILFLPQPCDLYIFGPIHPWFKMRCRQKRGGKKYRPNPGLFFCLVVWLFVWFFLNSLHLFCLLSWGIGR